MRIVARHLVMDNSRVEALTIFAGAVFLSGVAAVLHAVGVDGISSVVIAACLGILPVGYMLSRVALSRESDRWGRQLAASHTRAWQRFTGLYWAVFAVLVGPVAIGGPAAYLFHVTNWLGGREITLGVALGAIGSGMLGLITGLILSEIVISVWLRNLFEKRERTAEPNIEDLSLLYREIEIMKSDRRFGDRDREALDRVERLIEHRGA